MTVSHIGRSSRAFPCSILSSLTSSVAFSADNLTEITKAFLDLPKTCLKDGKPYIKSCKGGKQFSPEGFDHGMQVVFITEFESVSERDYYLDQDPVHQTFKQDAASKYKATGVVVLDFIDGQY
ncbi:hypothetical protein P7C73_g841, partial [Tremellales sp. Uapishka_1]